MAPTVLVLGGVGFIGRNLVIYLVENKLADYIRVADKAMPETSYFNERAKAAFADPCVDCRQANLANASVTEKIFTDGDKTWDIVFNLAAETKYGQTEEVYTEKVFGLSVTVAKEAVKRNVPVFVEFSTAQIYESDKKASSEDTKHVKPWTQIAKCKLKAEQELTKMYSFFPSLLTTPLRSASGASSSSCAQPLYTALQTFSALVCSCLFPAPDNFSSPSSYRRCRLQAAKGGDEAPMDQRPAHKYRSCKRCCSS